MLRGRRGLLNELRKLASRLDRPITADDVHFGSKPLYAALLHHFGTFPEARRAAGLPGPQWGPLKWSAAKVHAELRRLDRAGVRLTLGEVKRHGRPGLVMAILKHAGGIRRARLLAGLPDPERKYRARYSWDRDIVVREIKARHRGGEPLAMSRTPRPLVATACKLFGSWQGAIEAAGIDYATVRLRPRYDDADLLRLLRAYARKSPIARLSDVRGQPWGGTVELRFGSIEKAARVAGLRGWPQRQLGPVYSRSKTERLLRARAARGKPLYRRAVHGDDPTLESSVLRHFGSWM